MPDLVQHRTGAGGGRATGANRGDRRLGKAAGGRNTGRERTALGSLLEEAELRLLLIIAVRIGRSCGTGEQEALLGAGCCGLLEQQGLLASSVMSGQELLLLDGVLALVEKVLSDRGGLLLQKELVGAGRSSGDQKMGPGTLGLREE